MFVLFLCLHIKSLQLFVESQQQQGYRLSLYHASNDLNFKASTAAQRRVEEGQGSASAVALFILCVFIEKTLERQNGSVTGAEGSQ